MGMVSIITLAISYLALTGIVYYQTLNILKEEVRQEAVYIQTAIGTTGVPYLEKLKTMDGADKTTRITWVDEDGEVIYDSQDDAQNLDNHSSRPEVKAAVSDGTGEDIRVSDTVGQQMYYYALRLDKGQVLRISKTMDSMTQTAMGMLPLFLVIGLLMMILSWRLSKWQTGKIIEPINRLDIGKPLDNETYEELGPLLIAIDRQNKEKDAIAQMRKEFSANVSHELKTPLTSISGYAEIMQNGLVRPEDIPEFSGRIYKEARRLITLVEDIIKISKLDEESVELEKEEVDLYGLAREISSRLSMQAEERNIRVQVTGETVVYFGIRQILDEMIYNILENAIKYNVKNGVANVWVGNTLNGPKIVIEDTGIGIPGEHKERIFERFYRVDKSHSKEYGGTGLGLSIVKHGALLHGIEVQVESEVGVGTKISLLFKSSGRSN